MTLSSIRKTTTGIACAKCSHWVNRQRVVVHHATVADVRACCAQTDRPATVEPDPFTVDRPYATPDVVNAAWASAKDDFAELERQQERAAYEAKMRRDEALENGGPWPSKKLEVVAGRYAVEHDGVLKFYKVDKPTEGRWAGYTFVEVQASDETYPVRNRNAREEILALIAVDPQAAMVRYGMELGHCGHCGR